MAEYELDQYTNAQLLDLMDQLLDRPERDFDDALFRRAQRLLDARAPLDVPRDGQCAWADFEARNRAALQASQTSPAVKPTPRAHRWPRRLATLAATIALVLGLMVGAQAAGLDVFSAMGRWTNEVFRFLPGTSADLTEMADTLDEHGFPAGLAPSWLPYGFKLQEPKASVSLPFGQLCRFDFLGEGRSLSLQFAQVNSPDLARVRLEPKNGYPVEEFTTGDRTFFLFSGYDGRTATWTDGESLILTFTGNVSLREMQYILESIGD